MTRFPMCLMRVVLLANMVTVGMIQQRAYAEEETSGEYGTSIMFSESPAAAAKQAMEEEKLVFVLHVSGNFETSEYT